MDWGTSEFMMGRLGGEEEDAHQDYKRGGGINETATEDGIEKQRPERGTGFGFDSPHHAGVETGRRFQFRGGGEALQKGGVRLHLDGEVVTLATNADVCFERFAGHAGEAAFEKLFDMIFD